MKSNIFHSVAVTHPAYLTVKCNKELETVGLAAGWILGVTYFENCFDWDLPLILPSLFNSIGKDLCSDILTKSYLCISTDNKRAKRDVLNCLISFKIIKTSNAVSMESIE